MKIICVVCGLWLVEVFTNAGEVSYWCERCAHDTKTADSEQGDFEMLKSWLDYEQATSHRHRVQPSKHFQWGENAHSTQ